MVSPNNAQTKTELVFKFTVSAMQNVKHSSVLFVRRRRRPPTNAYPPSLAVTLSFSLDHHFGNNSLLHRGATTTSIIIMEFSERADTSIYYYTTPRRAAVQCVRRASFSRVVICTKIETRPPSGPAE